MAVDVVRQYCDSTYPGAILVLLCGSWARNQAHDDSDLDVLVLDPSMGDLLFEGVLFDSWLIEVCALSPERVESFFRSSAEHRSAPVPHQVVDGLMVRGDKAVAEEVKATALRVLNDGPEAPGAGEGLDEGLRSACQGDRAGLLELGLEVLQRLGGERRTYPVRY